jgi:UDP-N-acetylmuramate dehydrogenase
MMTQTPASSALTAPVQQWLTQQGIAFDRDRAMGPLTWYGIGGQAAVFVQPPDFDALQGFVQTCVQHDVPWYLLGSGANLLVAGDVDGVVVQLHAKAFKQVSIEGTRVVAGGGCDLARLILQLAGAGLAGLECLAGIPASVGGAVCMNAGGAFGAIGPCVERVTALDARGQRITLERGDLHFAYRHSNVQGLIVLDVTFALTPGDPAALRQRVKEIFDYKTSTQPMAAHSAGCAFKNPTPPRDPAHKPCPTDAATPGAGKLIDMAGLKGHRIGGAQVSTHHANFIIADPAQGCTPADVLELMRHVQRTVQEKFGIKLQREVVVWPRELAGE